MKAVAVIVVCGLFAACPIAARAAGPDPLATLEGRLLHLQRETLQFQGTATGQVKAQLYATATVTSHSSASFAISGRVPPILVKSHVTVAPAKVIAGLRNFNVPGAVFLRSIWLKFVRIGFMHDVTAMGSGDVRDPIAAAQTNDAERIRLHQLRVLFVRDPRTGRLEQVIRFDVDWHKKNVATATLYLDESGLPVKRYQVVHFPTGDMWVTETYAWHS